MPYNVKYILKSKIRELLVEDGKKLHLSGDAQDDLFEYFDKAVEEAAKELVKNMPRKSKGKNKGELKRITIMKEDFLDAPSLVEE